MEGLDVEIQSAEVPATDFVEAFAPGAEDYEGKVVTHPRRRSSLLIGAPPLRPDTEIPEFIRTPSTQGGFFGWLYYGFSAPRRAQRQRDLLQAVGTHLAKLKKQEQELLTAMGRAARLHGLAPETTQDLVHASEQHEQKSRSELIKAHEKRQEQAVAEREYLSSRSKGETQLAGLESQRAGLSARLEAARSYLAQVEQQVEQLNKREQELRRPPKRGISEEEVAQRVQEFESIKAQRKIAEMEVETARDQVRAAERPIDRIEGEISAVQGVLKGAEQRLSTAEDVARAAVVSKERRKAKAEYTVAEIDEEIGRHVFGSRVHPVELEQILFSLEQAGRQVDQWNEVLRLQQAELDQFDEKRARSGFWALTGFVLGILFLLFVGGETLRRLLS